MYLKMRSNVVSGQLLEKVRGQTFPIYKIVSPVYGRHLNEVLEAEKAFVN